MRRRPTACDRDIAQYVTALPFGIHHVIVEHDNSFAHLKPEGGIVITVSGKRIIFVPAGYAKAPKPSDYPADHPVEGDLGSVPL